MENHPRAQYARTICKLKLELKAWMDVENIKLPHSERMSINVEAGASKKEIDIEMMRRAEKRGIASAARPHSRSYRRLLLERLLYCTIRVMPIDYSTRIQFTNCAICEYFTAQK